MCPKGIWSGIRAPDAARRLTAIRERGGKVVVVDTRRMPRLMAPLHVLRAEGQVRVTRPERLRGLEAALDAIADVTGCRERPHDDDARTRLAL